MVRGGGWVGLGEWSGRVQGWGSERCVVSLGDQGVMVGVRGLVEDGVSWVGVGLERGRVVMQMLVWL